MKRDHKPKHDGLFPVFTFFEWNQCCKCGKDFRRESGWQFWTGPYYAAGEDYWGGGMMRLKGKCLKIRNKPADGELELSVAGIVGHQTDGQAFLIIDKKDLQAGDELRIEIEVLGDDDEG